MKKSKITSIKKLGKEKTYNLTMKSSQHNYLVYGRNSKDFGIYTQNSHSLGYGYLSWISAFCKTHYADEFILSFLQIISERAKFDDIEPMIRDAKKNCNIKFASKDINKCKANFSIEKKGENGEPTIMRPGFLSKGIGLNAAEDLANNAPYADIEDMARKTGSMITTEVISHLHENGFIKGDKNKFVEKFKQIREDMKKTKSKGVVSMDLFG